MLVTNVELEYLCNKLKSITSTEYHYISEMLELLYITGCRGQEAIDTSLWTVSNNQFVQLMPQKKNHMRLFNKNLFSQKVLEYLSYSPHLSNITSYRRLNYFINNNISHLKITLFNKNIVCHLFRHNYVRKLIQSGLQDIEIQQLLGHLELSTTQKYFNSPIESRLHILQNF